MLFALSVAFSLLVFSCTAVTAVSSRKAAPDISLMDLSGKAVKLSDYKGKVVFLNFFATWCHPCREEMPSMERLNKALSLKDFKMIAVSIDRSDTGQIKNFIKKGGFSFLVLHDKEGSFAELYGVYSIPATFIIDKKGRIAQRVIGSRQWDSSENLAFIRSMIKE